MTRDRGAFVPTPPLDAPGAPTAGPWHVSTQFFACEVRGADGELVAEGMSAADATLCASAPELRSSLEEVLQLVDAYAHGEPVSTGGMFAIVGAARAALNAARHG